MSGGGGREEEWGERSVTGATAAGLALAEAMQGSPTWGRHGHASAGREQQLSSE